MLPYLLGGAYVYSEKIRAYGILSSVSQYMDWINQLIWAYKSESEIVALLKEVET